MYYHYVVLKKNKDFLAVLTNQNTQWELGHYYDQGYAFFMEVQAFNATSAIKIAQQNEDSEIVKLQSELNHLRQEYQKLINENYNLKNKDIFGYSFGSNNLNPLEILGFAIHPTQDELKKRYRQLAQKIHPDKGGNDFLMKLIKNAFEQLNNSRVL
ncbi:J domain-containing protein [Aeromonas allosaccharophila]|uniref:J domain-containing protein n=1 Tax=Aeromonas allosaccharophila TaxID=656 RepID=UPI003D1E3C93